MPKNIIVIPCYNESQRFSSEDFLKLAEKSDLLLVNDGSKDNTIERIQEIKSKNSRIQVLDLTKNGGKGEAVRQGFLEGIKQNYEVIGYVDADFATPSEEILRLLHTLSSRPDVKVVMGSRVKLLGAHIDRKGLRHYFGRVFATIASLILNLSVYDTQCGAKFFRSNEALKTAMSSKFSSRWAFDVELISRLLRPSAGKYGLEERDFLEVPLHRWKHIGGSKLTFSGMVKAFLDLLLIFWRQPSKPRKPN